MPKYILKRDLLGTFTGTDGERRVLKRGEIVTEANLKDAGYDGKDGRQGLGDLLFVKRGGYGAAIAVQAGTEDYDPAPPREPNEPVTGGVLDTDPKPGVSVDGQPVDGRKK